MAKYKRLTKPQLKFIFDLYKRNILEYGEPNYPLIIEELACQIPPILVSAPALCYQIKNNLKKEEFETKTPKKSPNFQKKSALSPSISSPESDSIPEKDPEPEEQPQVFFTPSPEPKLESRVTEPVFNTHPQVSSLLDASRKKKEVETEFLQWRLARYKGNLKDIKEVEDEKFNFINVLKNSLLSFQESMFTEAEPLLLASDRTGARSVISKYIYELLDNVENVVFKRSSQDSETPLALKQRFSSPLDWAEANRIMSDGESPWLGRFSYKKVPYMREIVECFSKDSPVREVALKKGVQVMGTTCLTENIIGYYMSESPCNILVVAPTAQLLDLNVQPRIVRMLKSAGLEHILTQAPKRNLIKFKGGQLFFAGATSPDRFRNISVKVLILEELSGFPKDGIRGCSVTDLARNRTQVFEDSRKILYISSALQNGDDIDTLFLEGDQRYYQVPCPQCSTFQVLRFENLKYTLDAQEKVDHAYYVCNECQYSIQEHQKPVLFDGGKWVANNPEKSREIFRSYHLCGLYSPFGLQSWKEICQLFEDAKQSMEKMQVFQNTILGENYSSLEITTPTLMHLLTKENNGRLVYMRGKSPQPILYATIGVDVQKNRLELEVVGWCANKVNFSIDYFVFSGDPDLVDAETGCWAKLKKLQETISEANVPTVCLIDASDSPMRVYDYIQNICPEKWTFPIIGESRPGVNYPYRTHPVEGYADMIRLHVNTPYLKTLFFNDSFQSLPFDKSIPPRYVGMPKDYDLKHQSALYLSERPELKKVGGREVMRWIRLKTNNHPLDCRVYAMAGSFWIREVISQNILGLKRVDSVAVEQYMAEKIGSKDLDLTGFMDLEFMMGFNVQVEKNECEKVEISIE